MAGSTVNGVLVARAGLSPIMVGRAEELDRLQRLVADGAGVALISGEAGVGKTRLIRELIESLPRTTPVLAAQAEQGAMGRPYQLLIEGVTPSVAAWTTVPPALHPWSGPLEMLLEPVTPHLESVESPECNCSADELARAAIELVRHLVGAGPAALIFEDLQWADAESLGLFRRLASTPGFPLTLVGSYRPEDLDRRHVTDLLAAVEREHQVEHIVLRTLTIDEVRALVAAVRGEDVPYIVAADLHRRTAGNPFFVEELLVAAAGAAVEGLVELPLPATLTEAVLRHLDGLDPVARQVVDAAALLGQRIPFDLLASVTGLGEADLIDVLRALVGQGLIVEDDADVFSFRHALTREAVGGRLLGRERRRLHEKALAALQESGSDDWAALAYHAKGAGRWEDLERAARTGAARYLRTGATYQALRLAEMGLAEADEDLELLELATRAAWAVGLPESALERANHWRSLAEAAGKTESLSRALRVLARLRWETGDRPGHEAMVAAATEVAQRLPPGDERAWVANLAAESAMLNGRAEEAVGWAEEAMALAGPKPDPALCAAIMVNKGSALSDMPGRGDEAVELLLEGAALAEEAEDYFSALRAINNVVHPVFSMWAPDRSWELLERMARLIERSGREDWNSSLHLLRAIYFSHVTGHMARARAELRGLELTPIKQVWAGSIASELAIEAGDLGEAMVWLDHAGPPGSGHDDEDAVAAQGLRVRMAARRRDHAAMEAELQALVDLINERGACKGGISDSWYHALVCALEGGLGEAPAREAMAALKRSLKTGTRNDDPAWPPHLEGALAEAGGRFEDAVASYELATQEGERRRSRAALAGAHVGAARCLLALDRLDEARAHAVEADALLVNWPGWRRDEAQSLLHRLGEGRGQPSGRADLTARELEVAVLVARGLSNGEIGNRLYISTKTASVHVSNILRKLGMTSRAEVAAWAAGEGLLQD